MCQWTGGQSPLFFEGEECKYIIITVQCFINVHDHLPLRYTVLWDGKRLNSNFLKRLLHTLQRRDPGDVLSHWGNPLSLPPWLCCEVRALPKDLRVPEDLAQGQAFILFLD